MCSVLNEGNRVKRLLYLSAHRGCKETDVMLGDFAKEYLSEFSDEQLDWYEEFILQDDWNIYAWLVGRVPFPSELENPVTDMLRARFVR